MRRADWLLLLVGRSRDGLEPVRLQKALFLLAQEALPADQRYDFEPYNYGPMSRDIYRDVARLARRGLLVKITGREHGRTIVRLTPAGHRLAGELDRVARHEHASARMALDRIRRTVESLSFADLLRMVYDRYPRYASRSVFRRP